MPNHVHRVAVPLTEEALARGIGEAQRRYTRRINFAKGWRGHIRQGRFNSYAMDEAARMPEWKAYLALETPAETAGRLRLHERTMCPLGDGGFIAGLEALLAGRPRPGSPGRPPEKAEKTL